MQLQEANVSEQAFRSFIRAYGLFRSTMRPYFAEHGLSGAQWGILRALQRASDEGIDGLRLSELGRRLLVRPPSVTTLVDRLERVELVERVPSSEDQRAKLVKLTPSGRELVARVLRKHPAQIERVLAGLSIEEQRLMLDLMEKFAAHLETLGD